VVAASVLARTCSDTNVLKGPSSRRSAKDENVVGAGGLGSDLMAGLRVVTVMQRLWGQSPQPRRV
jgi:hypothetical protein